MDAVNSAMKTLFELGWAPFAALPAWVGVLFLGLVFGVVALLAMKYTTNAHRVGVFKDRCMGNIIAILLYRDSFSVVITSLGKTFAWLGGYLTEQFKPVLVMLIPFMLLLAQMQMRLALRPLDLGAPVTVAVDLDPSLSAADVTATSIKLPAGLELRSKIVHQPARNRVSFQVAATQPGIHSIELACGGETTTKLVHAGALDGTPMVMPIRSNGLFDRLVYPGEDSFGSASKFERVELAYPVRPFWFFGLDLSFGSEMGMMLVFVLITIVAAFGLKGVFGVTI